MLTERGREESLFPAAAAAGPPEPAGGEGSEDGTCEHQSVAGAAKLPENTCV